MLIVKLQELIVPMIIFVINLSIGLLALVRDSRSTINRLFFILTIAVTSWAGSSSLSDNSSNFRVVSLSSHLAFGFGFLMLVSAYLFARALAGKDILSRGYLAFVAGGVGLSILFSTNLVYQVVSTNKVQNGPLYSVYIASLIIMLLIVLRSFGNLLRSKDDKLRLQVRTIVAGFAASSFLILFSNAIIPYATSWSWTTKLGPLFTFFFVSSVAYAIRKHGLFDVRAFVARAIAYLLVLGTLGAVFATTLLILASVVFQGEDIRLGVRVVYTIIALTLTLTFQPLKRFFDRITNKLFYRDSYDSEVLLNELNRSLVTTIDLEELLSKSAAIINKSLRAEFCTFIIRGSREEGLRFIGDARRRFADGSIESIINMSSHTEEKAIAYDELDVNKPQLKRLLQEENIAIFVKMQGSAGGRSQHPGYIVLGHKRSGSLYSSQDIKILEIIADELVIATQNALRFEEIQQFNITLQKKVEEATKELRHANSRLRELDKTKDEFISMASHQLRTPLTTVKGYLSMILDGDVGAVKKDQKELMQHAFDGANRMVYLIADLLNVSRLQTGKFVIDNKPTNLPEVIEGEIQQLKEQAANRQIKLSYKKPEKFPTLNLDETKIRQVVMNFLDNALYYTPKGGKVEVGLAATGDTVNYTVTDTGVGVPKTVQHHLFSKFYRADNARKMRPDGTGLGLYMAKKVIIAQGGAIVFKSTEGKGSTFGFSFPRKSMEIKAGAAKPFKESGADLTLSEATDTKTKA